MVREAGRLFRPFGISVVQFNALHLLSQKPTGLRPSEVSDLLVVEASSTTYLLDRMEAQGWLRRRADANDRRANQVALTRKGRQLHASILPVYEAALEHLGAEMSAAESQRVIGALARLQTSAGKAVDHALKQFKDRSGKGV